MPTINTSDPSVAAALAAQQSTTGKMSQAAQVEQQIQSQMQKVSADQDSLKAADNEVSQLQSQMAALSGKTDDKSKAQYQQLKGQLDDAHRRQNEAKERLRNDSNKLRELQTTALEQAQQQDNAKAQQNHDREDIRERQLEETSANKHKAQHSSKANASTGAAHKGHSHKVSDAQDQDVGAAHAMSHTFVAKNDKDKKVQDAYNKEGESQGNGRRFNVASAAPAQGLPASEPHETHGGVNKEALAEHSGDAQAHGDVAGHAAPGPGPKTEARGGSPKSEGAPTQGRKNQHAQAQGANGAPTAKNDTFVSRAPAGAAQPGQPSAPAHQGTQSHKNGSGFVQAPVGEPNEHAASGVHGKGGEAAQKGTPVTKANVVTGSSRTPATPATPGGSGQAVASNINRVSNLTSSSPHAQAANPQAGAAAQTQAQASQASRNAASSDRPASRVQMTSPRVPTTANLPTSSDGEPKAQGSTSTESVNVPSWGQAAWNSDRVDKRARQLQKEFYENGADFALNNLYASADGNGELSKKTPGGGKKAPVAGGKVLAAMGGTAAAPASQGAPSTGMNAAPSRVTPEGVVGLAPQAPGGSASGQGPSRVFTAQGGFDDGSASGGDGSIDDGSTDDGSIDDGSGFDDGSDSSADPSRMSSDYPSQDSSGAGDATSGDSGSGSDAGDSSQNDFVGLSPMEFVQLVMLKAFHQAGEEAKLMANNLQKQTNQKASYQAQASDVEKQIQPNAANLTDEQANASKNAQDCFDAITGKMDGIGEDNQIAMIQLQNVTQLMQTMAQGTSNVSKNLYDTEKSTIGNIGH